MTQQSRSSGFDLAELGASELSIADAGHMYCASTIPGITGRGVIGRAHFAELSRGVGSRQWTADGS
jgi:hypothetical protein